MGHLIEKLVQFLKQVKGVRRTEGRGSEAPQIKKELKSHRTSETMSGEIRV